MVLTPAQRNKLLDAIEADNLVLLCGAGLSIPEPSKLISAVTVAQRCYDARQPVEPGLDPAWRTDI
ncbi:MAG: SIR2 family protein, partial [Rhizomicrobium sp.]